MAKQKDKRKITFNDGSSTLTIAVELHGGSYTQEESNTILTSVVRSVVKAVTDTDSISYSNFGVESMKIE